MAINYNNTTWFYDPLSSIIFRGALTRSQLYLLPYIPAGSSIMIIGGGTGWILEEIAWLYPSGLNITYVEMAQKMMNRSIKRFVANNQVTFINEPIENVTGNIQFDVLITPFLLDNFSEQSLQRIFQHIHTFLKPNGLWFYSDFQFTGKWWQKIMINAMLVFFRLACKIEASSLPDVETQFEMLGYAIVAEKTFFKNFIISKVYKKEPL